MTDPRPHARTAGPGEAPATIRADLAPVDAAQRVVEQDACEQGRDEMKEIDLLRALITGRPKGGTLGRLEWRSRSFSRPVLGVVPEKEPKRRRAVTDEERQLPRSLMRWYNVTAKAVSPAERRPRAPSRASRSNPSISILTYVGRGDKSSSVTSSTSITSPVPPSPSAPADTACDDNAPLATNGICPRRAPAAAFIGTTRSRAATRAWRRPNV